MGIAINGKTLSVKNSFNITQDYYVTDKLDYALSTTVAGESINTAAVSIDFNPDWGDKLIYTINISSFGFSPDLTFEETASGITDLSLLEFEDLRVRYYCYKDSEVYVYEVPYSSVSSGMQMICEMVDDKLVMTFNFTDKTPFDTSINIWFEGISFKSMKYDGKYCYYRSISIGTSPDFGTWVVNGNGGNNNNITPVNSRNVVSYISTDDGIVKTKHISLQSGENIPNELMGGDYEHPTLGNLKGFFVYGFKIGKPSTSDDTTGTISADSAAIWYKSKRGVINYA